MADLTQEDVSILEKFRAKAREFADAFTRLKNMAGNVPTSMQAEYNSIYKEANIVQSTINYITQTIDSVTGFFSNMFGLNGTPILQRHINSPQLGVLPLIPIALVIGAITAMGAVLTKIYLFERKLAEQKRLESQGLSPQQAADIASQNTGVTANIAKFARPVAFAFGAWALVQLLQSLPKRG
jgi:hypothetical protein